MTEEEAKTKWCPMVSCNGEDKGKYTPAGNCEIKIGGTNLDRNPIYARCIASDCMMWKEDRTFFKEGENSCSTKELKRRENAGEYRVLDCYCGLTK